MYNLEQMAEHKKLLNTILTKSQDYVDTHKIPQEKSEQYNNVISELRKINLDSVAERDWRVALEATKLFGSTNIKEDILKLFRIITDLFNEN